MSPCWRKDRKLQIVMLLMCMLAMIWALRFCWTVSILRNLDEVVVEFGGALADELGLVANRAEFTQRAIQSRFSRCRYTIAKEWSKVATEMALFVDLTVKQHSTSP